MAECEVVLRRVTFETSDGSIFSGELNIQNFQRLADFFRGANDKFVPPVSEEGSLERW